MEQLITPCGDNCSLCPKYTAKTAEELGMAAQLWYKAGWTERVLSPDEIKCAGCSSHKTCTYGLIDCMKAHSVVKCNQCGEFPCGRIEAMLQKSREYEKRCRKVCSEAEFAILSEAFFRKESNLRL